MSHPLNSFLEQIMTDALEEHDGKVSTDGRILTDLHLLMTLML